MDAGKRSAWLVLLVSGLGLLLFEHVMRGHARAGLWFQAWSSEQMMQTVSLLDLQSRPFTSLYYLHIQPPVLDAIRSLVVATVHARDPDSLLRAVDARLYVVWALVYAGTAALMFRWLSSLTHRGLAACVALAFCLHPAAILSATLLESTGLSALGVLWLHYELWRWRAGRGSLPGLTASVLLLFLTRSAFQWPFLLVVLMSLALLRLPTRQIARFALIAGIVIFGYVGKQYVLFGITQTSSFAGYNCARALGEPTPVFEPRPTAQDLPSVMARGRKLDGSVNFNHVTYLEYDRALRTRCAAAFRSRRPAALLATLQENLLLFLQPTSSYMPDVLVDALPWRTQYDALFQGAPLLVMLLAACAIWLALHRSRWRRGLALALPSLYIVAVCVAFEKGENMRFKFFVEPVWMLFIASQLWAAISRLLTPRPMLAH